MVESRTDRRNWLGKKLGTPASGASDRVSHHRETMEAALDRLAAEAEAAAAS